MPILGILASGQSNWLDQSAYFPIATTTLATSAATVTFSSIPSTYKHLQLRYTARSTRASTSDVVAIYFNSDTSSANYTWYNSVYGNNSGVASVSYGTGVNGNIYVGEAIGTTGVANAFNIGIVDLLDYASTSKYKMLKTIQGWLNSTAASSTVSLSSGNWLSTSAVTSLTLKTSVGSFAQYSSFTLYGIKG